MAGSNHFSFDLMVHACTTSIVIKNSPRITNKIVLSIKKSDLHKERALTNFIDANLVNCKILETLSMDTLTSYINTTIKLNINIINNMTQC